jgi:serine/threonine-protein kinase RsbW
MANDARQASQPFRQRDIAKHVSPSESNPDRLSVCLAGSNAIAQAASAARQFGEAQGLAKDRLARLCIVIEELVANLYDHGGVTEQDEVQLAIASQPAGIHVSIVDPGKPFDPWALPAGGGASNHGGAGLSLIRAWSERVSYRSSIDGNQLELLLPSGGKPGDDQ